MYVPPARPPFQSKNVHPVQLDIYSLPCTMHFIIKYTIVQYKSFKSKYKLVELYVSPASGRRTWCVASGACPLGGTDAVEERSARVRDGGQTDSVVGTWPLRVAQPKHALFKHTSAYIQRQQLRLTPSRTVVRTGWKQCQ